MEIEQSAAPSQWQTPTLNFIDGMVESESGTKVSANEFTRPNLGYSPSGTFAPTS